MSAPPAGIREAAWLSWPPEARAFILAQQQENDCCSTSTCATLPADVEASHYGPRLSALVGLLDSAFPLSFRKTQALLDQLLGVEISHGAIATIRERLSSALAEPMAEALAAAREQPVA